MRHTKAALLSVVLLTASFHAAAGELTVAQFESDVLPVLVAVDKDGKVINVSTSERLRPDMDDLLRRTIDTVLVTLSRDNGIRIEGQMVLQMKLESALRADGKYDARFVPVDVKSVPANSWSWVKDDARRRYALRDDSHVSGSSPGGHGQYEPVRRFMREELRRVAPPPSPITSAGAARPSLNGSSS
jgi:hypothetical protein